MNKFLLKLIAATSTALHILLFQQTTHVHAAPAVQQSNTMQADPSNTVTPNVRTRNLAPKNNKSTKAPVTASTTTKAPSSTKASKSSTPAPSFAPSSAPTPCPTDPRTATEIRDILLEITDASVLDTSDTPQNDAYLWLVNEDTYVKPCPSDLLQRYIIATFYYAADDEYVTLSNWLDPDTDECTWYNIQCGPEFDDSDGSVTSMTFGNLGGTIPREIGYLSDLADFEYSHTFGPSLTGTIPTEFGLLTSLKWFDLYKSHVTGTIPTEFGNLSSLQYMSLYHTGSLTGTIPTELGNLQALTGLYLQWVDLTGTIPTELGNLSSVKGMTIHYTSVDGTIPTELGQLETLKSLHLTDNDLTGTVPSELSALTALTSLDVSGNNLS